MKIREKFLQLTTRTYPHGTEEEVFSLLNQDLEKDEFGNLFIKIGESDVMFTSHLDTATSTITTISHVFENNLIKTDGKTILGADDKAGVTIMLHMIDNKIPGLYYFFLGEEVGCVGSRKVANKWKEEKVDGINKVISFDRRGTDSIITYQSGSRCCSEKFGLELSSQLNLSESTFSYKNDPTGILTDSIQFVKLYPECTNISVGYQNEHTYSEVQDIDHLSKLANACLLVDWNNLPVDRDPSVSEYTSSNGWGYNDYDYDYGYRSWKNSSPLNINEKTWFHDSKFNYVSFVEINSLTKKVTSVDLCGERISYEQKMIDNLLVQLELQYIKSEWNGFELKVYYEFDHISYCNRNDLFEYLPELDYKKIEGDDDIKEDNFFEPVRKINTKTTKTPSKPTESSFNGYCDELYD
jgi:hypothetical protein